MLFLLFVWLKFDVFLFGFCKFVYLLALIVVLVQIFFSAHIIQPIRSKKHFFCC